MRGEILPLTGLRACLAWWVVLFHFARDLVPGRCLASLLSAGHVAVSVFFVLSGYVLARRHAVDDLRPAPARRAFWRRRFARVYPVYLASLALGVAASWPRSGAALATGTGALRLGLQLFALNGAAHIAMFAHNWAAWSLTAEVLFYALFPLFFPWLRTRSRAQLVLLLGVSWALLFVAPAAYTALDPDHLGRPLRLGDEVLFSSYLKFSPVLRAPELVAGATAGLLVDAAPSWLRSRLVSTASGAALIGLAASGVVPYAYLQAGVLLPLALLLVVARDRAAGTSLLATPALVALGHASYATYILHVPVFLVATRIAGDSLWESPRGVTLYVLALVPISLVVHRFVEEPARRRLSGTSGPSGPSSKR